MRASEGAIGPSGGVGSAASIGEWAASAAGGSLVRSCDVPAHPAAIAAMAATDASTRDPLIIGEVY